MLPSLSSRLPSPSSDVAGIESGSSGGGGLDAAPAPSRAHGTGRFGGTLSVSEAISVLSVSRRQRGQKSR